MKMGRQFKSISRSVTGRFRLGACLGAVGLAAVVLIASGCGSGDDGARPESGAPQEQVRARAAERWSALVDRQFDKAYEYLTPGERQAVDAQSYAVRMATSAGTTEWVKADVRDVACETEICQVQVGLTYIYRGSISAMQGQEMQDVLQEKWILVNGAWWYVSH